MRPTIDANPEELKVFLDEADTLLESLDEHIVQLEQEGASAPLVQEIFRVAHTLKGSSGMLGFDEMARVTHAMEELFDRVRKGTLDVSETIVDALLSSLDGLKALKHGLASGEDVDVDVEGLRALLARSADDAPIRTEPGSVAPTALITVPDIAERLNAARAQGQLVLQIAVGIIPTTEWAAVRCFQVLNALDAMGEVLGSLPTQADIEAERSGFLIQALLVTPTTTSVEDVEQTLAALDEIAHIEVAPAPDPSTPVDASLHPAPLTSGAPSLTRVEGLQNSIRIDVEQLDALMNIVGELVIDRTRVSQLSRLLSTAHSGNDQVRALGETATHIEKIVDELHERMMHLRMLPAGLLFSKFPRLVRDLARSLAKSIRLELDGEDTEIDRSVIEQIKDPLIHLIRNACDHGIELPAARSASGKPEISILKLSARHEQGQIVITLEDDGRGIDVDRVKAKAIERGLLAAERAERLSDLEAVDLIFLPGLSTAAETTEVSGRGVGMDIVRRDIEGLGGRIEVVTRAGAGTTFRLRLPLTLATFRGLLVGCGRTTYAVPLSYVQETLCPAPTQIRSVGGRPVLYLSTRDTVMPIVWLDESLNAREAAGEVSRGTPYLIVVRSSDSESDRPMAIAVDRLIDQQDIVVKSLSGSLGRARGIAGASILGDGQVVLILDVPTLITAAQRSDWSASAEREPERMAS